MPPTHSQLLQENTAPPATTVSRWALSPGKRLFDLLCTTPLLIGALPLMLVTALAVKLSSPGPMFFRQLRIGKKGAGFEILKFRTMIHGSDGLGPGLTRQDDRRITAVGRVIRRYKLDELPQLWNVIRGDMSLVGPRPDLPEYMASLALDQKQVLQLRPGITSPATLRFRNEESLLTRVPGDQMTAHYLDVLLPQKVGLELEYAHGATLLSDLTTLLRTVASVFQHHRP